MKSTFAGVPSRSNVQATDASALRIPRPMVGGSMVNVQVMSRGLLNGLIAPPVVGWAVTVTVWTAAGSAGDAARPAADAGTAGLATSIAAPAPRATASAA